MDSVKERNEALIASFKNGANRADLAKKLGLTAKTVTNILSSAGVLPERRESLSARISAQANAMYRAGSTRDEVARRLKVGRTTVDQVLFPFKRGLARLAQAISLDGTASPQAIQAERARVATALHFGKVSEEFAAAVMSHLEKAERT